MRGGRLEVEEDGQRFSFGAPGAELDARIEVRDRRAYRWALRGGTGLGEGYVEGLWATDDLVSVIRIACGTCPPGIAGAGGSIRSWARFSEPSTSSPATPGRARRRTSPRTTTWATSSSNRSSIGG